jgi:hypothetical protein
VRAAVATRGTVTTNARGLRDAFDFVSAGQAFDHSPYISLDTGRIYWRSRETDLEEEDLPDDIDDSDRYLAVPSQRDLGLGRRLALAFVGVDGAVARPEESCRLTEGARPIFALPQQILDGHRRLHRGDA